MKKKEYTRTLTQKGQVTIPIEVRRLLGIGSKVTFVVENGYVRLKNTQSVVDRTAGVFKSDEQSAHTPEKLRAKAEEAISEETLQRIENK